MTLEELLRMTVPVPAGCVAKEGTPYTPDFRIAVQAIDQASVRIIVHALGHNSETLDFYVCGDVLTPLA